MGRITAYDQNGRMVADFDKSDYDFLCRYGRMPEEVLDENAKLRELCRDIWKSAYIDAHYGARLDDRMRELGIEVNK